MVWSTASVVAAPLRSHVLHVPALMSGGFLGSFCSSQGALQWHLLAGAKFASSWTQGESESKGLPPLLVRLLLPRTHQLVSFNQKGFILAHGLAKVEGLLLMMGISLAEYQGDVGHHKGDTGGKCTCVCARASVSTASALSPSFYKASSIHSWGLPLGGLLYS